MGTIRYGFLIDGNSIYDTKIQVYDLKKRETGSNIIYYMASKGYKRLYYFEILLAFFSIDRVFEILNFNSVLKKEREKKQLDNYLDKMANYAVTGNYPPLDLMPRQFQNYKTCQNIKKRIE